MSRQLSRSAAARNAPSAAVARARLLTALGHDRAGTRSLAALPSLRGAAPQADLLARLLNQEPSAPGERS